MNDSRIVQAMFRAGIGAVHGEGILQGDFTATSATAWSDAKVSRSKNAGIKDEKFARDDSRDEDVECHFHANEKSTDSETFKSFTGTFIVYDKWTRPPMKSAPAKHHYQITGTLENMQCNWTKSAPRGSWVADAEVETKRRLNALCKG